MPEQDRPQATIACTFPNGLELQLCEERPNPENPQQKYWVRVGDTVRVAGPRHGQEGFGSTAPVLTQVDKEFFDTWIKQNAQHPAVVGGHIKLHEQQPAAPETYHETPYRR